MSKVSKPNFIIAGVAKSATTSLGIYLSQHDDIFIPQNPLEPRFFVKKTIENISSNDPLKKSIINSSTLDKEAYYNLFKTEKNYKYIGEGSIHYFNHPEESIQGIKSQLGDIPIIIILRNPVDRMISNWKYISSDMIDLNFAIDCESLRISNGYNSFWLYKNQSLYFEKVKLFLDNFSKVKLLFYEEFIIDTNKVLNDCLNFFGLKNFTFKTDSIYNSTQTSYYIKNKIIQKFISNPKFYKYFTKCSNYIPLDKSRCLLEKKDDFNIDKKHLINYFIDDIVKLEELTNKDLSIWRNI